MFSLSLTSSLIICKKVVIVQKLICVRKVIRIQQVKRKLFLVSKLLFHCKLLFESKLFSNRNYFLNLDYFRNSITFLIIWTITTFFLQIISEDVNDNENITVLRITRWAFWRFFFLKKPYLIRNCGNGKIGFAVSCHMTVNGIIGVQSCQTGRMWPRRLQILDFTDRPLDERWCWQWWSRSHHWSSHCYGSRHSGGWGLTATKIIQVFKGLIQHFYRFLENSFQMIFTSFSWIFFRRHDDSISTTVQLKCDSEGHFILISGE